AHLPNRLEDIFVLPHVAVARREFGAAHPAVFLLEMLARMGLDIVERLEHALLVAGQQPERHLVELLVSGVHGPEAQQPGVGPQQRRHVRGRRRGGIAQFGPDAMSMSTHALAPVRDPEPAAAISSASSTAGIGRSPPAPRAKGTYPGDRARLRARVSGTYR